MESAETFGPALRQIRLRRGILLEHIATITNVPISLWEGLEDDDVSQWPSGVLARAHVAEYARLIGVDPRKTVDDFCRRFSIADRRRSRIVAEYGDFIGQTLVWSDDLPVGVERRAPARRRREEEQAFVREHRVARALDVVAVVGIAAAARAIASTSWSTSLLVTAGTYYVLWNVTGTTAGEVLSRRAARRAGDAESVLPLIAKATRQQ